MTWANYITIFRILCIPVFITLMLYYAESVRELRTEEFYRIAAVWVFAIAAISDAVDGFLARFCNQSSKLGAILDPAADKLLLLGSLIVLNFVNLPNFPRFPIWFTAVVISRDLIIVIFSLIIQYHCKNLEVRPHWTGKASTFFQFIAIVMFLLKMEWFTWACILGGILTTLSGLIYLRRGIQSLNTPTPST